MAEYITPQWPVADCVKSASTTRIGGVGVPPFDSFNLGTHVNDSAETVAANRRLLQQELALPAEPQWLNQTHGREVVYVDKDMHGIPDADAAWTDRPGCVLSVMTADCLPVLLASQCGTYVAVVHGGWRGLAGGILQNTVAAMPVQSPHELLAWLGPAIGPQCFEVGSEVRDVFLALDKQFERCFIAAADKYMADIFEIGRLCLAGCGVQRVYGEDQCTVQDSGRFFSHRRDAGKTGRMASLIWIETH